ncbi:hypothetical protein BDR04DRAFT_1161537 [Suillus decipiens]|nr:hypothetical protein BDR04DRAFT_1161537 [Suillus decipiens]
MTTTLTRIVHLLWRKADWDHALDDALKSIGSRPSLMGCTFKGIALCGKSQFQDAMKAFDLTFMFVDANLNKTQLLLLIKVRLQHGPIIASGDQGVP